MSLCLKDVTRMCGPGNPPSPPGILTSLCFNCALGAQMPYSSERGIAPHSRVWESAFKMILLYNQAGNSRG